MIPIKNALQQGVWLHCSGEDQEPRYEKLDIRLKVLSFEKVDFTKVDKPEKVRFQDEGIYWIMQGEVISLLKDEISASLLQKFIILTDQDGYSFRIEADSHLSFSEYAKQVGLYRLNSGKLRPKMKVRGAITFLLPDDDYAEYSIAIRNGTIVEA